MAGIFDCSRSAFRHTFGVRVLKMDRPAAGGFLSLTTFQAEGCGLPLCGNAYKVSVTGLTFSVIWQNNHSADWLAALPPFGGCATTLPGGKHVTGFSVAYGSLRIQFLCHPRKRGHYKPC